MIRTLRFGAGRESAGRILRSAVFEASCAPPPAAVNLVANGVRETLARLLGRPLTVGVLEPAVPDSSAVPVIFGGAYIFAISGPLCDLWLVFRPADARAAVAAIFAGAEGEGPLSPLEVRALARLARELVPVCVPLCGSPAAAGGWAGGDAARSADAYIELVCSGALEATVGVALFGDLREPPGMTLDGGVLLDVPVRVRAEFARGTLSLAAAAALECGAVVPLETKVGSSAALKVGEAIVAWGQCGFLDGRAAFQFSQAAGSSE